MKKISISWLILIQWILGLQWLHAAWGKWNAPQFMNSVGQTLTSMGQHASYAWYNSFLQSIGATQAHAYGNLIRCSELLVGVAFIIGGLWLITNVKFSVVLSVLMALACFGAAFMNLNFYLASGTANPTATGINFVMGLISLSLGIFYLQNREVLSER